MNTPATSGPEISAAPTRDSAAAVATAPVVAAADAPDASGVKVPAAKAADRALAKPAPSGAAHSTTQSSAEEHGALPAEHPISVVNTDKPRAPPALDLASLQQRLKDTHAIGLFTKLSLKNQVDDLLNAFRAYYGGRSKASLAELRQRYDLLLMKVLTLLQDSDPALASAVSGSRDAIWGILSDQEKFRKI